MKEKTLLEPKQKRSRATKNKIKETARRMFSDLGYYMVTSNNIATEAKVPIGSFYNYFGNKKGVLLELVQDFNDAFHEDTLDHDKRLLSEILSKKDAYHFLESALKRNLLSPHLADPFYKVIHALQFTEPDVLTLSEKIRNVEIDNLIKFLEQVNKFYPISDIGLSAKVIHTAAENTALYIHHLGTQYEREEQIGKVIEMFYKLIFSEEYK